MKTEPRTLPGFMELLPSEQILFNQMKKTIEESYQKFGFLPIDTPIIELSEVLLAKAGGETEKQIYRFNKGETDLSLRFDLTVPLAKFVAKNYNDLSFPFRRYQIGKVYRGEKAQKGRYRELRQMGIESYGSNDPIMDAEVISLGINFLKELGLDVIVKINSMGGAETRNKYREALINHFEKHIDEFCDDCKERLYKNPLRILDCKVDSDNELLKSAPSILDYLNDEEKENFDKIKEYLDYLEVEYEVDSSLVRGLDYYTNVVFEFVTKNNNFGSIGGGGRYNNLLKSLDGPDVPAVGFAFGFDRIIAEITENEIELNIDDSIDAYILTITEKENFYALELAQKLRMCGYKVDLDLSGKNMKAKFKESDRYKSKYTIIVGEEEELTDTLTLKDNLTKEEKKIELDNLIDYLDTNI